MFKDDCGENRGIKRCQELERFEEHVMAMGNRHDVF